MERAIKKCPSCKLDKWADGFRGAYCIDCARIKGRVSQAKFRIQKRDEFNEYHREYGRKHGNNRRVRFSDQHGGGGT